MTDDPVKTRPDTQRHRQSVSAPGSPDIEGLPYLVCQLGEDLVGMSVHSIRHVAASTRIWPLPLVPDYVLGVVQGTDRLVPLLDLRKKLGLLTAVFDRHTRFVELDLPVRLAVVVDRIEGLHYFATQNVAPPSTLFSSAKASGVDGIARYGDRLCPLLNLERILLGRSGRDRVAVDDVQQTTSIAKHEAPPPTIEDSASRNPARAPNSRHGAPPLHFRPHTNGSLTDDTEDARSARAAHVTASLSRAVFAGGKRIPGFTNNDPRLPAMALALLDMPQAFRTCDITPVVAALLDQERMTYQISHLRYDLGKFRARHLAERIGVSRLYQLTSAGRLVCQAIEAGPAGAELRRSQIRRLLDAPPRALSA